MKYLIRLLVFALLMLLAALPALAQDGIPAVTITASADGLAAPETVPAGLIELTFENAGEAMLFAMMARLNEDVTMDDFMGALMQGPENAIPLVTLKGSPAAMPGESQVVTYHLEAGQYVLMNMGGEEPQIANFVVEGETADASAELESDLAVTLVDFAFGLPTTLPAGEQTWLIENAGEQWHEMAVIPVPDGMTLEEVMPMLMAMEEEAEGDGGMPELAMLWSPISPGENAWVAVDLAPGMYLVGCFLEDVTSEEGAIHLEHGMIQLITVEEAIPGTTGE